MLLINLLPVFTVEYFFTGDGPAHLYNSNLILQLLGNGHSPAASFFDLKTELIPNLGGHALLVLFNALLPARIAEQIVFALAMAGMALGFRYLLRGLDKGVIWGSFLVFPLLHNFCFYIGFQSFCLGLAAMLLSIGYFIRMRGEMKPRGLFALALLLFITAIFHLFTAIVAILIIGIILLNNLFPARQGFPWKVLWAILPTLLFCGYFLVQNSESPAAQWLPVSEVAKDVLRAKPLITIDSREETQSVIYAVLLLVILTIAAIRFFKNRGSAYANSLGIGAGLLLILSFTVPNEMATGGLINIRLLLCFFIFLSLWAAYHIPRSNWMFIPVGALVALNLWQVNYHIKKANELNADAQEFMQALPHIEAGATVLPLNYSYHWLHYNIGCYLGAEKEIIVLDNYEAGKKHFPVSWKEGMAPNGRLGDFAFTKRPLLKIDPYEKETGKRVDFVVLWQHSDDLTDSATVSTMELLDQKFWRAHRSGSGAVKVFQRKNE